MQDDCDSCSACCLELLASQRNKPSSSPLIFHYHSLVPTEVVGAYARCLWVKVGWHPGYVASLLHSHIERQNIIPTFMQTYGLFRALIHPTCMSLDCGLKFENACRQHENMQTTHRNTPGSRIEPAAFFLWDDSTNHCTLAHLCNTNVCIHTSV